MIDRNNSRTTGQAINVGIYGCTKAGKTRFLFQLLNRWERTRRLLGQSETCQKFLATVESEIEKHGGSMPTVATTEGIRVKVRSEGNDPPLELVFRDLRGELLSGELDQIASLNRNGVIPTQVRQCDAFLFFFDPASSENPADIDKHHQRELKRAKMFIEYVLKVRENRHLPIIFVLTHLDRWENDVNIRGKADRWANEVHAKLVELYYSGLRSLHPKTIVDRSRTIFRISSVDKTPEAEKRLQEVVDQLIEMVADSKSHRRWLRKSGLYSLIAGAVVLSTIPLVIWLLSSTGSSLFTARKADDRSAIAELPEREIITRLDDLDRMLRAHPPGKQLPSVEEAKKVNHHLRWLTQRLEPDSGGTNGLSEETMQRMRSALESLAKVIQAKADSDSHLPADLTPILGTYLEDLPDMVSTSPVLAAAQTRYWLLQRAQVVEQVASIMKR
ncbi:MAG: GTPase domain-containing protein, partial [Nitrospira sp.]|nr:GTPase domain-containing protein [Nitrospira sp.]